METSTLIFFDDYPLQSENLLFVEALRRKLGHLSIHIEVQKTFNAVEESLRTIKAAVIVLDIMARVPPAYAEDARISSALAGVEVLRRCRSGFYGSLNQATPIFIRTARGEPYVRKMCLQAGATGYCLVGTDDRELVDSIKSILEAANE